MLPGSLEPWTLSLMSLWVGMDSSWKSVLQKASIRSLSWEAIGFILHMSLQEAILCQAQR